MGTDKRERQKANRADRIAAAEDAARKAQMRSRLVTYGIIALVIAAAIVGVAWLTSDDDDTAVDGVDPSDSVPSETLPPDQVDPDPTETVPTETVPTETLPVDPVEFVYGDGECPAEDGSSERTIDFDSPPPLCIDPAATHAAVFDTSEGEVRVELDTANTPGTVNNFVTLARWGYYDDTVIFRTDPSIDIVQGGSPHTQNNTDPGPGYRITDEPTFATDTASGQLVGPYRYVPGQLVMARSAGPDSASAQFFFTTGPLTSLLDNQGVYVVFGDTDEAGLGVLQTIIGMHEDDPSNPLGGGPSETVTINSVTIEVS